MGSPGSQHGTEQGLAGHGWGWAVGKDASALTALETEAAGSRTVLEMPTGNLYFSLVLCVFPANIVEPNHH